MIEVKNIKKTYIGKDGKESRGLVDVSFKLDDKGFVFVLGKSGSGKSTLLNIIGGLDKATSGEVIIEGKKISDFSEKEFDYYKSHYCGFIFQDYKLLNELNVYENILLSLEIKNDMEDADNRIKEILNKVGLDGYENKMINELSGGEKQRVAIARCLIKNPKIILCDEPTGNLDKKTSKQILDALKEVSKNCLVFMVSHDNKACDLYASRRLTINDGLIIDDSIKNESFENKMTLKNNTIYLPSDSTLNDEDLKKLNQLYKENKIDKIDNLDDAFIPFNDDEISENTSYGWTNWSSPQSSNIYMQIDWDNALVYIDSNYRQLYQIVKVTGRYRDSDNSEICEMKVIDQDGDRGTMKLAIRPNGKSQIYIIFSNIRWCYDVVRL